MRCRPYPKHKSSGVEWLGDVPEDWEIKKLRHLALLKSGENITSEELEETGAYPVFGGNGLLGYSSRFTHQGDYALIGRQGALCGNVNYASGKFWASEHAVVVSPLVKFATRWMGELLRAMNLNQYSVSAAQPGLSVDTISALRIPVPPFTEQEIIADFLERETEKLDTLTAKKRELIEKLKEKRTALISWTVTRGLNSGAKLKTSGIEWLGEIPEHWEVMMLKRTWSVCEYGISESLSGEGPVKVLTMGNIQDGRVLIPEEGCLEEISQKMLVQDADLLFNRTNSLVHVAKVGIYYNTTHERVTFASYLVRVRMNRRAVPEFMNFLLNTAQILDFARGLALPSINQANLNPTRYGQIKIPLPPVAEQRAIANYLDGETAKIDRMVAKVEEAIERLQEYRTALITAAVTGKIDVRNVGKRIDSRYVA